jgi:hypothetical protein
MTKRTVPKKNPQTPFKVTREDNPEFQFTRGARIGLLFLLALTALFVVGALYSNYKLEDYEDDIRAQIEARIDGELQFGKISLNGVRGIRIEDVELKWPIPNGPSLYIQSHLAYIDINLTNLLYGKITLDRITLDHAQIDLDPSQSGRWLNSEWKPPLIDDPRISNVNSPFRISGNYCTIRINNLTGNSPISLSRATLDIARLMDSPKITGGISGFLARDTNKKITINAEYVSPEDFTLRADCTNLDYQDINGWMNSEEPFVLSGNVNPKIRIHGGTGQTVIFNILAPFNDLKLREHPDYINTQSGYMSLFATYLSGSDDFNIITATVETDDWQGQLEGRILVASKVPEFDLQFQAEKFPLNDIVNEFVGNPIDEWGTADFGLMAPYSLLLNLGGTPDSPEFSAKLSAQSGELYFEPDDSQLPALTLALGTVSGNWDSTTEEFTATIEVEDGEVNHSEYEIKAEQLKGTLTLANNRLNLQPLNATIFDNTFVATLDYDLSSGTGKATLNGILNEIENTAFKENIKHTELAGSLNIKAEVLLLEDRTTVDAYLDATQTDWGYQWWFTKPPGIGAMGAVHMEINPGESVVFDFDADVASSKLQAQMIMAYQTEGEAKGTFGMDEITLSSNYLDINTLSKCLNIPYEITGGNGMWGHFAWNKLDDYPGASRQDMNLFLNEINLTADSPEAESPIHLRNALFTLTLVNGATNTGELTLAAEDGELPPFTQTWLVPADPPEGWPVIERDWSYQFDAKRLSLPPWKGTNFRGEMYSTEDSFGFKHYFAEVGKGSLTGTYEAKRAENEYTASVNWSNVPARYFLEHLNYPEVMTGDMTGEVTYTIDKDDPNTLKGTGYFETRNGDFTSDFLYALLQGNMDNPGSALPPTMNFSFFRSDVEFQGDKVLTPVLKLEADGMNLEGFGEFIHDGDLDYKIKVGITPELAESIPALSSNFNLQGHKLANRDIDLAFNIGGPTFRPRGELAELPPASVTLVHGALEMSRDAISIIDVPRKILVDLLKIGGGIVKKPKIN